MAILRSSLFISMVAILTTVINIRNLYLVSWLVSFYLLLASVLVC